LQRYGLSAGAYLLAVSSPKANKNFGLIPRALRLLDAQRTMPVAVAGSLDSRVYRDIGSPSDQAMNWLGYVPDDELNVLYRHAAWFVFPSLYEGFGLPPLEAMANGCPVLAARAASIPEIYGDAVLYFDAHDPASLAALLREVTTGTDAAARRNAIKRRADGCLARQRWDANAEILLDRLIAVRAVAVDDESIGSLSRVESVAPLVHS
jgi:glycosyltransferase involved in cell wall biosynthesis